MGGGGALAGFGSAKCSNEEAYLFQKLIRACFGTNNVDHCTRLCHASSVAALLEGIGSGAVTTTYGDIQNSDVAILTGTNTINLKLSDILDADPDVTAASGDPNDFEASDLDADPDWDLFGSAADNDLTVLHPGGTIELTGVTFVPGTTFDDLAMAGVVVVDPS